MYEIKFIFLLYPSHINLTLRPARGAFEVHGENFLPQQPPLNEEGRGREGRQREQKGERKADTYTEIKDHRVVRGLNTNISSSSLYQS